MNSLAQLINAARHHHFTSDEREAQMRSFVYGNIAIDNPRVTRDMVARQDEMIKAGV